MNVDSLKICDIVHFIFVILKWALYIYIYLYIYLFIPITSHKSYGLTHKNIRDLFLLIIVIVFFARRQNLSFFSIYMFPVPFYYNFQSKIHSISHLIFRPSLMIWQCTVPEILLQ